MINTSPLLNYVSSLHDIKAINQWRTDVEQQLQEAFDQGQPIRDIIHCRSNFIDEALIFLWEHVGLHQTDLSLFAVGGYGRREMLPYSDVDIMILSESELNTDKNRWFQVLSLHFGMLVISNRASVFVRFKVVLNKQPMT